MTIRKKSIGLVRISTDHLLLALGLPDDAEILNANMQIGEFGVLQLLIEHGGMPAVMAGELIPVVDALFENVDDPEFVRWHKVGATPDEAMRERLRRWQREAPGDPWKSATVRSPHNDGMDATLLEDALPRGSTGVPCECGGYADVVDTTDEEERRYGCGRPRCCCAAFKCRLCGKRLVASFPAPDPDF